MDVDISEPAVHVSRLPKVVSSNSCSFETPISDADMKCVVRKRPSHREMAARLLISM